MAGWDHLWQIHSARNGPGGPILGRTDFAITDPCVEEGYLFSGPDGSKFDSRVVTVNVFNKFT